MFRAVQVSKHGGPEMMKVITRKELPVIKKNEILVKISAAAVNPVDTYIREGWHVMSHACPYTPGLDCSGEVIEVGDEVMEYKVGDRVFSCGSVSGTYATHGVFTRDQKLYPLPKSFDMTGGCCIGTGYLTSLFSIQCCRDLHDKWILVQGGSGGVGSSIIKLLLGMKKLKEEYRNIHIITSCSTERSKSYLQKLGVDFVMNHRDPEYMNRVKTIVNGKGPDVVFEILANVNLQKDLEAVNKGGEVIIIGNRGTIEINPRDVMTKGLNIHGVSLFNQTEKERKEALSMLNDLANAYPELMKPYIDKEYKLEDAGQAHVEVIKHTGGTNGRIVINPWL